MKRIKIRYKSALTRVSRLNNRLQRGALSWCIILLLTALFLAPYAFPGVTNARLGPYLTFATVVVTVAAYLRSVKGALLASGLITAALVISNLRASGLSWPLYDLVATFIISFCLFLLSLVTGYIRSPMQQLQVAHAALQKQALTDGLTDLPNHRAVIEQLHKEVERTRRYNRPLSVLFLDADHFKRVNDTHGHAAGDAVLRQIGERAGSVLRGGDTLGRFGGEEFVILLPEADAREASVVAERIRAAVAAGPATTSEVEGGIAMTVSIGLATYPTDGDSAQELLSQADEAMYVAKRLGRNQVRTAQEARQVGADVELMALLQQEGQHEAALREGITPERLRESYTLRMIYSLLSLLQQRDESLSAHAHAVSDLATTIAQTMGLAPKEVSRIGMAALLHDIGKVAIPDRLLQKVGPLSSQERALLRNHAELGAQILEASPFLYDLMPAVRHHHERWDGRGSPDQLKGEDIPQAARIIAIAEAYDFMLREHPYQASRSPEEALAELRCCAGTQFDPAVVQALQQVLTGQEENIQKHTTFWIGII